MTSRGKCALFNARDSVRNSRASCPAVKSHKRWCNAPRDEEQLYRPADAPQRSLTPFTSTQIHTSSVPSCAIKEIIQEMRQTDRESKLTLDVNLGPKYLLRIQQFKPFSHSGIMNFVRLKLRDPSWKNRAFKDNRANSFEFVKLSLWGY